MYVLGIDPGTAKMGLAILELQEGSKIPIVKVLEVIETEKASKKSTLNLRVTNDDLRRYGLLHKAIETYCLEYKPVAVGIESYRVMGKFGGNAWKSAVVYGIAIANGFQHIPFVSAWLPNDIKKRFCQIQAASKFEVELALAKEVIGLENALEPISKGKREHAVDAACHAVLALEEFTKIREMAGIPIR